MGKVISFGLQKGGVAKTTTTAILAYLMSKDKKKVLAVDMDSQGNLTELLTDRSSNDFIKNSILEAIAFRQPKKYTYKINDYIDLIPSNNFLASFARWIYIHDLPNFEGKFPYKGYGYEQLDLTLQMVKDEYDYILIDTPPALSEQTSNALIASDYVVILYEGSKFCYSAVPNFMDTVQFAMNKKGRLKILGILRTLLDKRRTDVKLFNEAIEEDYPDLVFETIITHKAKTGRIPLYGFEDNKELDEGIHQFKGFYKELLNRIKDSEDNE